MLLALALLLAFPTFGLSLVAYLAWVFLADKGVKRTANKGGGLSNLERAVQYVGTHHNGSVLGTAFEGITMSDVLFSVVERGTKWKGAGGKQNDLEFSLVVQGTAYAVYVSPQPGVSWEKADAIFRVRAE
jgi:hypothetical protein